MDFWEASVDDLTIYLLYLTLGDHGKNNSMHLNELYLNYNMRDISQPDKKFWNT